MGSTWISSCALFQLIGNTPSTVIYITPIHFVPCTLSTLLHVQLLSLQSIFHIIPPPPWFPIFSLFLPLLTCIPFDSFFSNPLHMSRSFQSILFISFILTPIITPISYPLISYSVRPPQIFNFLYVHCLTYYFFFYASFHYITTQNFYTITHSHLCTLPTQKLVTYS